MHRDDPGETLAYYRPPAAAGVELLSARSSFEPWHVYHEQYAVCATRTAATHIRYRGKVDPVVDRSVCFFEPGEVHRTLKVHKRSDFMVLFMRPEFLEHAFAEMGGTASFNMIPEPTAGLFDAVYAFAQSVEAGAEPLEQQSRLALCLEHFRRCSAHPGKAPRTPTSREIGLARSYLVERYDRAVTLEELGRACGVSKFHLVRQFARHVGLPPHAFQVHVRIERARELLRRGLPAVEVAMIVGFADQSHLNRHFRRIWGMTASEFARLARGNFVLDTVPAPR